MFGKTGILHHNFNKVLSNEVKNKISLSKIGNIKTIGENYPMSKLKSEDIYRIRELYNISGITQIKISDLYNVSYSTINLIIAKKTWRHLK